MSKDVEKKTFVKAALICLCGLIVMTAIYIGGKKYYYNRPTDLPYGMRLIEKGNKDNVHNARMNYSEFKFLASVGKIVFFGVGYILIFSFGISILCIIFWDEK